ncbi:MAG TPA: hypothetical protein VG916_13860, partial [Gemmatimonadaceae bacterium]|nr:hypothetical protein [Gemmatimonadaceae bacterium]
MDRILATQLNRSGKRVETVRLPDGTALLCLPYGGRVLGLFAPGDTRNFYWVNPVLGHAATARV